MIEGLDRFLEDTPHPGRAEVRAALQEVMLDVPSARLGRVQCLKRNVYRVEVEGEGVTRSVVVKRLSPDVATRNHLAITRWLPALGLARIAPRLLAVAAARNGSCIWHLYEDLGDWGLNPHHTNPDRIAAAIALIARLHTGSAGHPVLMEARQRGGDRGIHYFVANVQDAILGLETLRAPAVCVSAEQTVLRDRLLKRLTRLLAESRPRAQALEELGGPDVLLHGDLWTVNAFVQPVDGGMLARLIDWDHVGVGPLTYDLSTFLYRYPAPERWWILDHYQLAIARSGWRLPATHHLNQLFDTAESARYASRVIWPCLALLREHAEWGFAELAEIDRWFEDQQPVMQ